LAPCVATTHNMKLLKRIAEIADKSADRFAGAIDFIIAPTELPRHPTVADPAVLSEVTSDSAREKRAARRDALQLPATIAVGFVGVPDPVEIRNLSSSGLCFLSPFRMGVGEVAEVAVTLPPAPPNQPSRSVRYQVRVVHARPHGDNFSHGASIRRCIAVPVAA